VPVYPVSERQARAGWRSEPVTAGRHRKGPTIAQSVRLVPAGTGMREKGAVAKYADATHTDKASCGFPIESRPIFRPVFGVRNL
jgi:hypothetical protein